MTDQLLRALLAATGEPVLLVDGARLSIRDAAAQVFGYSRDELIDLPAAALVPALRPEAGEQRDLTVIAKNGARLRVDALVSTAGNALVVALRERQDDLREVNRFLDAVVENIPDMIFVKDAATLLFKRFNRAGEELLGWKRSELLGKTDHDFYPKEQADFFHLKDRETLAKGELVDIPEEPIETRTKGSRWLHTKKVPVFGDDGKPLYLLGISEDITARKAAEERVRALERELASLVAHASDAVISWDLEGRIVSWNGAADALYGKRPRRVEELVPEASRADFRARIDKLLAGARIPVAEVFRLRGSQEIELEESLFPVLDGTGAVARIASIARDVGELARLRRATEILGRVEQVNVTPAKSAR